MEITLMRHGVSDRNILLARHRRPESWLAAEETTDPADGILVKHDSATRLAPAAERYIAEAIRGSNVDVNDLPDIVYVSPFRRTLETYDAVVRNAPRFESVPVIVEPLIVERDWGIHDIVNVDEYGHLRSPLVELAERAVNGRKSRSDFVKTVNGESHTDVVARAATFWNLIRGRGEERVFVVSHAEFLGELARVIVNGSRHFHFANSEVVTIDTAGGTVNRYNPIAGEAVSGSTSDYVSRNSYLDALGNYEE